MKLVFGVSIFTAIKSKSTVCGCQLLAAAAFRNTSGMFNYKQQRHFNTLKWQYHYYVKVQDDSFQNNNKVIFPLRFHQDL